MTNIPSNAIITVAGTVGVGKTTMTKKTCSRITIQNIF